MDTTVVPKKEPVPIIFEPEPEMIRDADGVKVEETVTENPSSISCTRSVPDVKEEIQSCHFTAEIVPYIKTLDEDEYEDVSEEIQKDKGHKKSYLLNDAKNSVTTGELTHDSQQGDEGRLHSPLIKIRHKGNQLSPSTCNEKCEGLEMFSPPDINGSYSCNRCGKTFTTRTRLINHKTNDSSKSRSLTSGKCIPQAQKEQFLFKCNNCNRSFGSYNGLQRHKVRCTEVSKTCCCDELGLPCSLKGSNSDQRRHSLNDNFPFFCCVCRKYFQVKWRMREHMTTHLNNKCITCSEFFPSKRMLKKHKRTHSEPILYTCNDCNKTFNYRKGLVNHMVVHSNVKPFSCDVCGFSTKRRKDLLKHHKVHSNKEIYTCNYCNKRFKSRQCLFVHMVVHKNVKPFSCDDCGFATKNKYYLSSHLNVHSNNRPYKCSVCDSAFKQLRYLRRHRKIHLNEK